MRTLPHRHIHLDFHTSPHITGVGKDFEPDRFADRLVEANVQSVTLFARCHHGMMYFDSTRHASRIHPHLTDRNLLRHQIEACQTRGIHTPIYTTVQWDHFTADEHRDWLVVDEHGCLASTPPLDAGFYRYLDVLHPGYRAFLREHVAELFELLPVDGLFFDIVQPKPSLAKHWLIAMSDAGIDAEDAAARKAFAVGVIDDWKREMTAFIREQPNYDPNRCTIFYNSGHVGPRHRTTTEAYTHYELESLPSGGWGYLHFPLAMRFAHGLGKPCLGMTGKFHASWGDFHSLKNPAALQFEIFHMLALGAACSIGDQLHPFGKLDEATLDLIGGVYASVEKKQPWCEGTTAVPEIGVLTGEEFAHTRGNMAAASERQPDSMMGAVRMLQELGRQFDIITSDRDFKRYRMLILPDEIPVDDQLRLALESYIAQGGAIIASHRSGLDPGGRQFALAELGVDYLGEAPYSPDFVEPGPTIRGALQPTSYVMYQRATHVQTREDASVLAEVQQPFFNRTWRHFCSHAHTPSSFEKAYPGIVQRDRAIYFAHPIFSQYQANAPRWCRQLLDTTIDRLIGPPLVQTDGPSSLINVLRHQPSEGRYILHLLHYIPERRGAAFDVIEDVIPLHQLALSISLPAQPKHIRSVPDGRLIDFNWVNGHASFQADRVDGHAMIEIMK